MTNLLQRTIPSNDLSCSAGVSAAALIGPASGAIMRHPAPPNPPWGTALGNARRRCILTLRSRGSGTVAMRNLDDDPPVVTLSAGPVDAYPVVLRALSRPVTYDFDPSFQRFYEAAVLKTAEALRTALPPVILQGEPVLGLEAAAAALIRSDDAVLNLASGEYGKGFGVWAARHCRELVEIEVPYDDAIDPESVREMLTARPDIRILSVCHHDTPSGTINPVREIGAICRAHGVLTIVDAVSSFGGMDVHPEAVHADIFVTGPNKCLGGSTGLCIVHVSERAWARIDANPAAPTGSVLSLKDWRDAWRADVLFPFTPSVSEVHALDAAVRNYLDEGPEAVWARHALTARACRAGVRASGLDLWPVREAICADTATTVRVPDGLDDAAIRQEVRRRYGVVFSAGRGSLLGKLVRIGHMGPVARPIYAIVAVTALGGAVNALGGQADVGAGVEAALAIIEG